jgi:peroxin-6
MPSGERHDTASPGASAGLASPAQVAFAIVVSAEAAGELPAAVRRAFSSELYVRPLGTGARLRYLDALLGRGPLGAPVLDAAATTALLHAATNSSLLKQASHRELRLLAGSLLEQAALRDAPAAAAGAPAPTVTAADVEAALKAVQSLQPRLADTPAVPNVSWDDVGGLVHAKREITDLVQLSLQHPELFSGGGAARSGLLLFGPPGTGKTLLAKAMATECGVAFMSVKVSSGSSSAVYCTVGRFHGRCRVCHASWC